MKHQVCTLKMTLSRHTDTTVTSCFELRNSPTSAVFLWTCMVTWFNEPLEISNLKAEKCPTQA